MERWFGVYVITALSLLAAPPARARPYFVAKSGLDTTEGRAHDPWKTLYKACNTATAGDTVYVGNRHLQRSQRPECGPSP